MECDMSQVEMRRVLDCASRDHETLCICHAVRPLAAPAGLALCARAIRRLRRGRISPLESARRRMGLFAFAIGYGGRHTSPRRSDLRSRQMRRGTKAGLKPDTNRHEKSHVLSPFRELSCAVKTAFVSGEASQPEGCGGQTAKGETKSQAQTLSARRNRRKAIRCALPFSWSRVSAIISQPKTRLSPRPLLDHSLGICAKIDKQPEFATGKAKIVQQLRAMFLRQFLHGLDLNDYLAIAVKVRNVGLLYWHALVEDAKLFLRVERDASGREFALKALLIDFFPEAVSQFAVDFIDGSANGIAFLWIYHRLAHGGHYSKLSCFSCREISPERSKLHQQSLEGCATSATRLGPLRSLRGSRFALGQPDAFGAGEYRRLNRREKSNALPPVREISCAAKAAFVSGETSQPEGCGGQTAKGETKSQAQTLSARRNRRKAIRRALPFSWSRVSAITPQPSILLP